MNKDINNQLQDVIQTLIDENKKPTVALIKNRLVAPVPLPLIIQALQCWKQTGKIPKMTLNISQQTSTEERILELEKQIRELNLRLLKLEQNITHENPMKD